MSRFRANPSLFVGLAMLALLAAFVALGQVWTPHDPFEVDYGNTLQPPSLTNWFGTDDLGRDVASRVLAGGYVDLKVALICVVATLYLFVRLAMIARAAAARRLLISADDLALVGMAVAIGAGTYLSIAKSLLTRGCL